MAVRRQSRTADFQGSPAELIRGPRRIGFAVIATFFGAFGLWGYTAPLAGGAIAQGAIAPDGSVRSVQHLEGGMVETIFVRDGDRVRPGMPLIALRRVQSQADVEALLDRRRARLAEAARLDAELSGASAVDYPDLLQQDAAASAVMEAESLILTARDAITTARKQMLRQRIVQLEEQIVGFAAQQRSALAQIALYEEEIADKSTLYAQGLTPKMEMLRLEREAAQLRGFRGEYDAAIAQARQQIGETELELLAADAERMEKVALRAGEVRSELAELGQELAARQDVLTRTVLTAPVEGVVSNLRIKTLGGVIGAGEVVLDIVPTEEKLVLDVEVTPVDIDVVEVGMEALVHLTALSSRVTPRITGTVVAVSAERISDPKTNRAYFLARVEVDADDVAALGDAELTVGMPAEVVIVAKERTMFDYLAQPFVDALRRAGREI